MTELQLPPLPKMKCVGGCDKDVDLLTCGSPACRDIAAAAMAECNCGIPRATPVGGSVATMAPERRRYSADRFTGMSMDEWNGS